MSMRIGGIFGRKKLRQDEMDNGMPGMQSMVTEPKRPGFFQRDSTQDGLATFADTLIKLRSGVDPGLMRSREFQKQKQFAEAQYERRRTDDFADWQKQQDYARQNKAPDAFTQRMIAAGIDPNSDEGREVYRRKVENETMDWIEVDDGAGGKRIVPRASQIPTRPVGKLTPIEPNTSNTPAPELGSNGLPQVLSPDQYQAVVNSLGKDQTDKWLAKYNIKIGG